ncbi:MAG: TIR domain-containing protein [Bacteroidales bacterium]|nr:TIR domain-containing protein [Bacteroidales bacterium]
MKYKIFTSYKYGDEDVKPLGGDYKTTVRGYVDKFEDELNKCKKIDKEDKFVFKGEEDGVDLSGHPRDEIRNKLSDKIYESTITVLFISPNMRTDKPEDKQWIPWEMRYSLQRTCREGRKPSPENAVVAVILPDKSGSYRYHVGMRQFTIVKANIDNGYIQLVRWSRFLRRIKKLLDSAIARKKRQLKKVVHEI